MEEKIKLMQFSKGAGCGCKIPSSQLDIILKGNESSKDFANLLVGNNSRDDAAAYDLGDGRALITTTDFFTPIVDDAFDFGRIASCNAINDVYAMGGKPLLAVAILGWNMDTLPAELAQEVIKGSRKICEEAGIPLAGGHSINTTDPIFGLAVNGIIPTTNLKKNNAAQKNDLLFLTKPLGVGIISTAVKKGIVRDEDYKTALALMITLNKVGEELGKLKGVNALTDVTGFGLLGHLIEMAEGSNLCAELHYPSVPMIKDLDFYIKQYCYPGNVTRNWGSYEKKVTGIDGNSLITLCDPQTSGGLLIAVNPDSLNEFHALMKEFDLSEITKTPIGKLVAPSESELVRILY
ncbi:MAG: selenide, water dikinase SelD [Bacteroidota bacterium]